MKTKIIQTIVAALLVSSGAAYSKTYYYSLVKSPGYQGVTDTYTLLQSDKQMISDPDNGIWVVEATPGNLYDLLNDNWSGGSLQISSDIDLQERDAAGGCIANHKPLPFKGKVEVTGSVLNGLLPRAAVIKNLCYEGPANQPIGFFESVSIGGTIGTSSTGANAGYVKNGGLVFDSAYINITGASSNGADYYSVGVVFGEVNSAYVSNVKVMNSTINAPFAGAIAGLQHNTTFKTDSVVNVRISNNISVTDGYAGSATWQQTNLKDLPYSVVLGGVSGLILRNDGKTSVSIEDVYVNSVTIEDVGTESYHAAWGVLAGIMVSDNDSVKNAIVVNSDVSLRSCSLDQQGKGSIKGGTVMGGFAGAVFGANMESGTLNEKSTSCGYGYFGKIEEPKISSREDNLVGKYVGAGDFSIAGTLSAMSVVSFWAKDYPISLNSTVASVSGDDATLDLNTVDLPNLKWMNEYLKGFANELYSMSWEGWECDTGSDCSTPWSIAIDGYGKDLAYNAIYKYNVTFYYGQITGSTYSGNTPRCDLSSNDEKVTVDSLVKGIGTTWNTSDYDYTFCGWTKSEKDSIVSSCPFNKPGDLTNGVQIDKQETAYYAQYVKSAKTNKYTISFVRADGTKLESLLVAEQVVPAPQTPENYSDEKNDYKFVGWDPELAAATQNQTYTAVYASSLRKYTITLLDGDGNVIGTQDVEYGRTPEAPSEIPTKASDAQYDYVFKGWSFDVVDGDATYEPEFDAIVRSYRVVFDYNNHNSSDTLTLEYGKLPEYNVLKTLRATTKDYAYDFKGWSPTIETVKGDAMYTAVYDSIQAYTVNFIVQGADGKDVELAEIYVPEGDAAFAPIVDIAPEGCVFWEWDKKYDVVTNNMTVYAKYKYIVKVMAGIDGDDLIDSTAVEPSKTIALPSASLATDVAGYEFAKWVDANGDDFDGDSVFVDKAITFVAQYKKVEPADTTKPVPADSTKPVPADTSNPVPADTTNPSQPVIKLLTLKANMEQSGSAIRLSYEALGIKENVASKLELSVTDAIGMVVVDSVLVDDISSGYAEGKWASNFAPGKYVAKLVLTNGVDTRNYSSEFEVDAEIVVTVNSWQMVAMSAIETASLGSDASIYWWDESEPLGEFWQYRSLGSSKAKAGRGYWYGTTKGKSLTIRAASVKNPQDIVWEMDSLYSGWNMVANPYGWAVSLKKGISDNCKKVVFYRWDALNSSYDTTEVLAPYEAVWAQVSKKTTCSISAAPVYGYVLEQSVALEKASALQKSLAKGAQSWNMVVSLTDEYGKSYYRNVIGTAAAEEMQEEPPAGRGDRVNLSFLKGKKKLTKFIKSAADKYEWNFVMSASTSRNATLNFAGLENLQKMGYKVQVSIDGKVQDVTEQGVKVALSKTSTSATVSVISASSKAVVTNGFEGFRVGQNSGDLNVRFEASENMAGATAHYVIADVKGKVVASGKFTATAGSNSIAVKAPKSGLYFVNLKVNSVQKAARVFVK